jgi:multidrug efflux pump subunit AcrB
VGPGDADILVSLKPKHRPTIEYQRKLRNALAEKFPGVAFWYLPDDIVSQILNFGLPAPIDVQVIGADQRANREIANKILGELRNVPGAVDLHIQQPFDEPELSVDVDRTKAQQVGYSQRDVAQNLLVALSGSFQTTPSFFLNPSNGVSYNIAVQSPQPQTDSLQGLSNIPVTSGGAAPPQILGNLATITRGAEQATVTHYDVQPVVDVYGGVDRTDLADVATSVSRIVKDASKSLPRGTTISVRGQILTMHASYYGLAAGLTFAIALVYMLIVVNFQSWKDPFIIVAALPAALAGIIWFLFLTGTHVSVPALTGAIMCMGVATANSILVVSFAKEQIIAGKSAVDAALTAGFTRFRPVIMTALAMIIGMFPMALGLGEGGEQNAPLGRAVIGGLSFATAATLFFVPVFFSILHRSDKLPTHALLEEAGDSEANPE